MKVTWHGIYPAATTHFHNDQALDLPGTLKHLDEMLAAGIDSVIMLGTVGENCSLEYREKLEVLRATVEHVARRVPVLTGVAEYTTALACRFAADAQKIGVDGLMVLPAMVHTALAPRHARQAGAIHQGGDRGMRPGLGIDTRPAPADCRQGTRRGVGDHSAGAGDTTNNRLAPVRRTEADTVPGGNRNPRSARPPPRFFEPGLNDEAHHHAPHPRHRLPHRRRTDARRRRRRTRFGP